MTIRTSLARSLALAALTAMLMGALAGAAQAATGAVRITFAKAGFIVGVGSGTGTLRFKNRLYRIRVGGVSAGTIGVAQATLVGTASNLQTASDIAGSYSAVSAGIAVAGGGKTARLQNANGVVLQLHGTQVGFEASLNMSGVTISIE